MQAREARGGSDGNILCERSLPFTYKYLKTINLGQQQGRNTRKEN
jgi:hypothetical protein